MTWPLATILSLQCKFGVTIDLLQRVTGESLLILVRSVTVEQYNAIPDSLDDLDGPNIPQGCGLSG